MAYEHEICAKKILINLKHHEEERGKPIRRALLTKEDIKQCANREQLKEGYVNDLIAAMYDLGWLLVADYEGKRYYLIDKKAFNPDRHHFLIDSIDDLTSDRKTDRAYANLFGE
ncbi:MAG: hypothetical protein HDR50_00290 [Desulfovibrio sp.]|uniref:hypothetical protein n=1 Tax=Desulfovibrio sp. TaxID=885 RepID=UPI001A7598AE|nr:hypothetical protein [Desulfovibrio sp.]MBD5416132.1 hypothetical protein [Desulfovibrio sp.]